MSRTFKMLISNWPRTRKFNRLLRLHAGKAIAFDLSHCHALITLYVNLKLNIEIYIENPNRDMLISLLYCNVLYVNGVLPAMAYNEATIVLSQT